MILGRKGKGRGGIRVRVRVRVRVNTWLILWHHYYGNNNEIRTYKSCTIILIKYEYYHVRDHW